MSRCQSGRSRGVTAHHGRCLFARHGPAHQRFEQSPTSLTITALEASLPGADTRRTHRGIVATPPPSASDRQGTALTSRRGRPTQLGAEVHHRLVPRPRRSGLQRRIGRSLSLLRGQPMPRHSGEHPSDVGVDHRSVGLEGKDQNCTGGVLAHPGQSEQIGQGRRELAAGDDLGGRGVQVSRPPRVAEPLPQPQHIAQRCRSACCRRRERGRELLPLRNHPSDLRLLQHHLADENRPGIAGSPPREITQPGHTPFEDSDEWFASTRGRRETLATCFWLLQVNRPRRRHRRTADGAPESCRASTPSPGDGSSTPPARVD